MVYLPDIVDVKKANSRAGEGGAIKNRREEWGLLQYRRFPEGGRGPATDPGDEYAAGNGLSLSSTG